MTVCVATLGQNEILFCAADRMLTRRATQTEPDRPKIYNFPALPHVTIMWAGDSTIFGEVIQAVLAKAIASPSKYVNVSDAVRLYCDCFSAYVADRAERAILNPLNLTRADLASSKVTNDRAKYLIELIVSYSLAEEESVWTIFAGHDSLGGHIWATHNKDHTCHDVEGFAAIGIGAEHADAQLRFSRYTRTASPQEALVMAYLSKRRAEIAPSVGRAIDLCSRFQLPPGSTMQPWSMIPPDWIENLDVQTYENFSTAERTALAEAVRDGTALVQKMAGAGLQSRPSPLLENSRSPESTTVAPSEASLSSAPVSPPAPSPPQP